MIPLLDRAVICLDLEMGGIDPERSAVLAVGVSLRSARHEMLSDSWTVSPAKGTTIVEAATAINGWTGPGPGDVKENRVIAGLTRHVDRAIHYQMYLDEIHGIAKKRKPLLLGHGVHMDRAFVAAMARRCNLPNPFDQLGYRDLDSRQLAMMLVAYGMTSDGSLDTLCAHLGIHRGPETGAHHNPLVDARDAWDAYTTFLDGVYFPTGLLGRKAQ